MGKKQQDGTGGGSKRPTPKPKTEKFEKGMVGGGGNRPTTQEPKKQGSK